MALPAKRLSGWLAQPTRSGVLTDFDGTLAPIVRDPATAAPLPGISSILARLAGRYARVAVISGRPVAYLLDQVGTCPGLVLCGLYGMEQARDGVVTELPDAGRWRTAVERIADAAEQEAPAGVHVERKGLSLALHVRTAPSLSGWVRTWADEQAARTGLVVRPARMAVELLPPLPADKGRVVTTLAVGLDRVCYLGDDHADLEAFAALRALSADGVETLAVAVDSAEAPPELGAAADAVVDGPEGARDVLEALAGGAS